MAKDRGRPWYRWCPRDFYASSTVVLLTKDERRRYREALDLSWMSATPGVATVDQWRKWLDYSDVEWPDHAQAFASGFADGEGVWVQERLLAEYEHATSVCERATSAVRTRYGRSTDVLQISDVQKTEEPKATPLPAAAGPVSGNGLETPARKGVQTSPEFDRFWDAYKCFRRTGKPIAWQVWKRVGGDAIADQILAALDQFKSTEQWKVNRMPEPERWLKRTPWDGGPVEEATRDKNWDPA